MCFFCSIVWLVYCLEDGGFQGLDLGQVFGVIEMVLIMYLCVCYFLVLGGIIEVVL